MKSRWDCVRASEGLGAPRLSHNENPWWEIVRLLEWASAGHIQGMIDHGFYSLQESYGVGQFRMDLEGSIVDPVRVDPEESRIANGLVGPMGQATWLSTRLADLLAKRGRDCGFLPLAGKKAGEYEELQLCAPIRARSV